MERKGSSGSSRPWSRRRFGRTLLGAAGCALYLPRQEKDRPRFPVALVRGRGRAASLSETLRLLGGIDLKGKEVWLKGNFNSPDPYPATTHPDTLAAVVQLLRKTGCSQIHLVERSGMGVTREVWRALDIDSLARRLSLRLVALDELPAGEWRSRSLAGSHWKNGVEAPRFLGGACVVQIANLKTHRFGGVFSASLKNSIGLIAKHGRVAAGRNYMEQLHASPNQCAMIAEVNLLYRPEIVFMDAESVFVTGGPEKGELAHPGAFLASRDRVSIDAAGLALLRLHTPPPDLERKAIFEQAQLKRAAEIDLGAKSPEEIEFKSADARSATLARRLEALLADVPEDKKNK